MDIGSSSSAQFVYEESEYVTPDYSGRRGQKTTISDVSVKKRVLLVCVYNKRGTLITHDIIYRLFMKYGEIYKILIFDKCKNWKIFVEMATLEQAEKARDGLNNYQLFDDGSKMTVYYAKVDQIVFQNNNSGGVDYRELKLRKNIQSTNFSPNGVINSSSNLSPGSQGVLGLQGDLPIKKPSFANGSSRNSILNGFGENSNTMEKHRNNSFDYSELYRKFESVPNTRVSPQRGSVLGGVGLKKNSLFQTIQPVQIVDEQQQAKSVHVDIINDPNIQTSANDISNCENDEGNNLNQIQDDIQRLNLNNSPDQSELSSQRNENSSPQSEKDVDKYNTSGPFNMKSNNEYRSGNNTAIASSNNFNTEVGSSNHILVNNTSTQPASAQISAPANNNEICSFSSTNNNNPENQIGNTQLGLFNKGYKIEDEDDEEFDEHVQKGNTEAATIDPTRNESGEGNDLNGGQAQGDNNYIDPSNYVNPLYILENKKSRVIYVRGLEKKNLTTKKIYNLFSNFGNIELILYFTEKKYCLIQFETQEDATIAKEHLDSLKVEQNQMRIFYSNYETIKENQEGEKQCEIWKGEKNSFRFRNGKQISINPVTNTLHVSNLKFDTCKQEVINEKFSSYGTIDAFHPLTNQNKYMCHVKFSTSEEAMNALCNLHEEEILGRKMHISFTRARISPQQTPDNQIPLQQQISPNQYNYSNFRRNSNYNNSNQNMQSPNGNQGMNPASLMHQMNPNNINQNILGNQKGVKSLDPNLEINQSINNVLNDDEECGGNNQQQQQQQQQQAPQYFYPHYQQYPHMQSYPMHQFSHPYQQYPVPYNQNGPMNYHVPPNQIQQNQVNQMGYYPHYQNQQQQSQMNAAGNMQNNNFTLFK